MISVIMPVYNAGRYLYDSIGSIIEQSYRDWELLLIDDGSEDKETIEIIESYRQQDKRIRCFKNKKEKGAAGARNTGLELAEGDYILILDADDIFDHEMFESMYRDAKKCDADMCICGYVTYFTDLNATPSQFMPMQYSNIMNRVFRVNELGENGLCLWNAAPWNKIYNTQFLKDRNLMFQNLPSANDVSFSFGCACQAKRIVWCKCDRPLVKYRLGTETQISSRRNPVNYNYACEQVLAEKYIKDDKDMKMRLFACWLVSLTAEIKNAREEREKKMAYDQMRNNLIAEKIREGDFDSRKYNLLLTYYLRQEDFKWMELVGDYYAQLCMYSKELYSKLFPFFNKIIVIWGYGKRGRACERYLNNAFHVKPMITDRSIELNGNVTELGNSLIRIEDALVHADVIIASNDDIYRDLVDSGKTLICLETYCCL